MLDIRFEIESGFMDVPVPVVKLNDGAVKFWIHWSDWEDVSSALREAMNRFPDYVAKAREDKKNA